jgi:hypothetical protein
MKYAQVGCRLYIPPHLGDSHFMAEIKISTRKLAEAAAQLRISLKALADDRGVMPSADCAQ